MEKPGASGKSVGDTRAYNEILILPFGFDFLEKRLMEIKLPATTVQRHNKSTAYPPSFPLYKIRPIMRTR